MKDFKTSKSIVSEKLDEEWEEYYPETGMKMIRPVVNVKRAIIKITVVILTFFPLSTVITFLFEKCSVWENVSFLPKTLIIYFSLLFICSLLCLKRVLIFIIRIYQSKAPYETRCRCLFIPNCSEYMILAIKKYGVIKGVYKGIKRFLRCKDPNGGEDYP